LKGNEGFAMNIHNRVMTIGALATAAGVAAPTIRYYEEIGLLPAAPRSDSGQRRYGAGDVARLTFIRRCRDFGFSIAQVRVLAGLSTSAALDCAGARDVAAAHLVQVQARIVELTGFAATLAAMVAECDATCFGGAGRDCVVVGAMQGCRPAVAMVQDA
jgi:MerR family transcriptional regulator, copper efflux regulator